MRAKMKPIIPKHFRLDEKRFKDAIEDALNDAAKQVKAAFEDTVQSWDTPVRFITYSREYEREVSTSNKIYFWVNDGTKKHKITVKGAKALAFRLGGAPKTRAGVLGSGEGNPGGAVAFAKYVMHPGIKPRKFNKLIRDIWLYKLPQLLQKALNDSL